MAFFLCVKFSVAVKVDRDWYSRKGIPNVFFPIKEMDKNNRNCQRVSAKDC